MSGTGAVAGWPDIAEKNPETKRPARAGGRCFIIGDADLRWFWIGNSMLEVASLYLNHSRTSTNSVCVTAGVRRPVVLPMHETSAGTVVRVS